MSVTHTATSIQATYIHPYATTAITIAIINDGQCPTNQEPHLLYVSMLLPLPRFLMPSAVRTWYSSLQTNGGTGSGPSRSRLDSLQSTAGFYTRNSYIYNTVATPFICARSGTKLSTSSNFNRLTFGCVRSRYFVIVRKRVTRANLLIPQAGQGQPCLPQTSLF